MKRLASFGAGALIAAAACLSSGCSTISALTGSSTAPSQASVLAQINSDLQEWCPGLQAGVDTMAAFVPSLAPKLSTSYAKVVNGLNQACTSGITLTTVQSWTPAAVAADVAAFQAVVNSMSLAVSVKAILIGGSGALGASISAALAKLPPAAPAAAPAAAGTA
jgi:uncharacterized protein YceK